MDYVEPGDAAGRHELALACANLWATALAQYFLDCESVLRGVKTADTEALEDLTGSGQLLANLCQQCDADPERLAGAMIEALNTGLSFRFKQM